MNHDWILRTRLRWELVEYINPEHTRYRYRGSINRTIRGWHIVWPDYSIEHLPEWDLKTAARRVLNEATRPTH